MRCFVKSKIEYDGRSAETVVSPKSNRIYLKKVESSELWRKTHEAIVSLYEKIEEDFKILHDIYGG